LYFAAVNLDNSGRNAEPSRDLKAMIISDVKSTIVKQNSNFRFMTRLYL